MDALRPVVEQNVFEQQRFFWLDSFFPFNQYDDDYFIYGEMAKRLFLPQAKTVSDNNEGTAASHVQNQGPSPALSPLSIFFIFYYIESD